MQQKNFEHNLLFISANPVESQDIWVDLVLESKPLKCSGIHKYTPAESNRIHRSNFNTIYNTVFSFRPLEFNFGEVTETNFDHIE